MTRHKCNQCNKIFTCRPSLNGRCLCIKEVTNNRVSLIYIYFCSWFCKDEHELDELEKACIADDENTPQ